MVIPVNQVHTAVDRWCHGPWCTTDRDTTEACRSARRVVLQGRKPHRDGSERERRSQRFSPWAATGDVLAETGRWR
jgi:hypothetical protein